MIHLQYVQNISVLKVYTSLLFCEDFRSVLVIFGLYESENILQKDIKLFMLCLCSIFVYLRGTY